ncbi:MAG: hypothetical protein WA824_07615 [Candidatus Sulfotelmatobacter sp.]
MAEFVHDAQQDFWQSPARLEPSPGSHVSAGAQTMANACAGCGTEYMIGAKFCHACGGSRPSLAETGSDLRSGVRSLEGLKVGMPVWLRPRIDSVAEYLYKVPVPRWLRYLHFHEIQRRIGLPTASLIAFFIGLGCIAGAACVSFFYKASNLAEFQAIQMWRLEWLMAATASFVAGILLKAPSGRDKE